MEINKGIDLELKNIKKGTNIALANNEKKLNLYAKQTYHIQGLDQSRWGFWLSVAGSIIGFIVIIVSIVLLFMNIQTGSIVTMISGIIIEAISGLFFWISDKATERVIDSFDKLRLDSNIVNSLELAKTIENTKVKDALKVKLSLYLVGINEENICKYSGECCTSKDEEMNNN